MKRDKFVSQDTKGTILEDIRKKYSDIISEFAEEKAATAVFDEAEEIPNSSLDMVPDTTVQVYDLLEIAKEKLITETTKIKHISERIFLNLNRTMLDTIIVSGRYGTGVTTAIEYFTQQIAEKKCQTKFHDAKVLKIGIDSFKNVQRGIDIYVLLCAVIEHYTEETNKIILVIDSFEETPSVFKDTYTYVLKCLKATYDLELLKVIIGICEDFYEATDDEVFDFMTEAVSLELPYEVTIEHVMAVLKPRIDELSKLHSNVKISKPIFERFAYYLYCNTMQYVNYSKIICELDFLFAIVEASGRTNVTENDIREVFSKDFLPYQKVNVLKKIRVARHEIGHTILALRFPNYIDFIGVKIVGNQEILGGTLIRYALLEQENSATADEAYTIAICAFLLAGRLSEQSTLNLGAADDLQRANDQAKAFVMANGSYLELGMHYVFDDSEVVSEETLSTYEQLVKAILSKAEILARKVLDEEKDTFDALVDEIMKKDYLTAGEVKKIWNKHHKF